MRADNKHPSEAIKYSYYPGCTAEGTSIEFDHSSRVVCKAVGIELLDLEDWSCCGASSAHSLNHELSLSLPGRNVALAQEAGLDVVIPCPACYQNSMSADNAFREDEKWRQKMEGLLGFEYKGQGRPRHILDVFRNDLDIETFKAKVTKPLKGLKVASYYGCVLVRPPEKTGWDDPEHPTAMDDLIEAVGATPVDWSYKVDCCGASMTFPMGAVVTDLSTKLVEGAIEAGADCIAAACGICQINLDARAEASKKLPVLYFTELVALAFGWSDAGKMFGKHTIDPRPLLKERNLL
ncbi:MAG: heterodisulfide reductase subunit B [Chloroflexi bacterium]|nr:heterodisulfide reductase subunit B [Chloroflexota bacterium]